MIRNFDKETCPLNSYELDVLLSRITTVLKDRFGKDKAITNEMIRNTHLTDYLANEARVLKVINHIRTIGIVKGLMATSRGYIYSPEPRRTGNVHRQPTRAGRCHQSSQTEHPQADERYVSVVEKKAEKIHIKSRTTSVLWVVSSGQFLRPLFSLCGKVQND